MLRPEVQELRWLDPPLGEVATPKAKLRLTLSVGSGLARRPGDRPGVVWGLGDRGPNIKVAMAIKLYGLDHLSPLKNVTGAKVLPLPAFQPRIAELRVGRDRVSLIRTVALHAPEGPLSGRALPGGPEAAMEPTFDLDGAPLQPDPLGVDPEGLVALSDGGFWISEEYGPSLLRIDAQGLVCTRWTPVGLDLPGGEAVLPASALDRRLNRGFEGLATSADERRLYVVFQSARTGEAVGETTIWTLDARDGALLAEHAYPFDPPGSFTADAADGDVEADDLKVCELVCIGADRLLVLERITRSARIYAVDLSAPGRLAKTLVFSTDDHPQIAPDLEGVVALSDRQLLIATDNDFGTEGAETRFYRLTFATPF